MVKQRTDERVDGAAFDVLYRREVSSLVALAASLSGSRDAGAEIAQEALLRAYCEWPRVGSLERPGAWVRRVTINLAIDAHRRTAREQRTFADLSAVGENTVDPPGYGIDHPLWVAVRALPERQRAVVALHYLDDLPVEEIAHTLELSMGTVKSTLFSARASLARTLGAEEVHDDDAR